MKQEEGIVTIYNGYTGRIKSKEIEYLLLNNNISNKEQIKENDEGKFIPEIENGVPIARFVKKKVKPLE